MLELVGADLCVRPLLGFVAKQCLESTMTGRSKRPAAGGHIGPPLQEQIIVILFNIQLNM